MPISCTDGATKHLSYEFGDDEWAQLRLRNGKERHLRFECCGSQVSLRVSTLGTKYFAHARRDGCQSAPETAEHLMAKAEICSAIKEVEWHALPERRFEDEDGILVADVFACRSMDTSKGVAFEIQWSSQTAERTSERTKRYVRSGIRPLWLMRQDNIPVSKEVPAVRLEKTGDDFNVRLPHDFYRGSNARERRDDNVWLEPIPLKDFIKGVLAGKLRFGHQDRVDLPIDLHGGRCQCRNCGTDDYVAQAAVLRLDKLWPGNSVRGYGVQSIGAKADFISRRILERMRGFQWDRSRVALEWRAGGRNNGGYMAHRCSGCRRWYRAPLILGNIRDVPDDCFSVEVSGDDLQACVGNATVWSFDADGSPKWTDPVFRGCSFE